MKKKPSSANDARLLLRQAKQLRKTKIEQNEAQKSVFKIPEKKNRAQPTSTANPISNSLKNSFNSTHSGLEDNDTRSTETSSLSKRQKIGTNFTSSTDPKSFQTENLSNELSDRNLEASSISEPTSSIPSIEPNLIQEDIPIQIPFSVQDLDGSITSIDHSSNTKKRPLDTIEIESQVTEPDDIDNKLMLLKSEISDLSSSSANTGSKNKLKSKKLDLTAEEREIYEKEKKKDAESEFYNSRLQNLKLMKSAIQEFSSLKKAHDSPPNNHTSTDSSKTPSDLSISSQNAKMSAINDKIVNKNISDDDISFSSSDSDDMNFIMDWRS
ncbi:hypothetical protein AYI69_g6328 [Smittium culicis]|uniref:Uncharacterized protein n=1 Tax=Smittium culicis TaxID=133412 RepID=A0A1R1XZQ4_9FUNG|nr:hypothetical protein AYI69_g6328 [Smittium culicis]